MTYLNYPAYRADLESGKTSAEATVKGFLAEIKKQADLNVFIETFDQEALEAAKKVDLKIKNGSAGSLAGMVVGIKDVYAYKNHGLTASSKILKGFISQYTGTSIQRLLDQDVIIIGRQNCDEFAMGSSNENSAYGPTLNAADKSRVPGGSSGASAVAVQAGLCHVSIGSDTGGSVRQPAAFCGVWGLKPTYGRISRWGLAAYASSFDCVGPIATNPIDLDLVLEIMSGPDGLDSTALPETYIKEDIADKKLKIAYLKEVNDSEALDPELKAAYLTHLGELKQHGHELMEVPFPYLDHILPTYYILTMAEASSNLSRYDGVRYGHRTEKPKQLEELYKKTKAEGFGKEVKKRIILGSFILSADYYDAYYLKALRVRNLILKETEKILDKADLLLMPTSPGPAFKIGEKLTDPIQNYLADIFTVHANVVGMPALAYPIGQNADGLPLGAQVLAAPKAEAVLFSFAKSLNPSN
jgi:aspartyl-tRNA(Asn)/glutamyl-tRNA(Gln) amidotransferase subunit A